MPIDARAADPPSGGSTINPTVIPALYEHALRVYNAMRNEAVIESIEGSDPTRKFLVYDGHLTNLFKRLRLSVPYYTKIKNMLVSMGCIEQVRRGGGNGTSKWFLWYPPGLEAWKVAEAARPRRGNKQTVHDQQIKDLAARVAKLEMIVEQLLGDKT